MFRSFSGQRFAEQHGPSPGHLVRQVSPFSATGGPNGLDIGPDGAFYLCNNGGSRYVEGTSMGPHPDYKRRTAANEAYHLTHDDQFI